MILNLFLLLFILLLVLKSTKSAFNNCGHIGSDLQHYERKIYSQNGEDGILLRLLNLLGRKSSTYVEFGVEDGSECNTRILREHLNFTGLLMDGGYENSNINLNQEFITSNNVISLFEKYNISKNHLGFDVLSLDIDMFDFWVLSTLLKEYSPRIIIVETNPTLGLNEGKFQPNDFTLMNKIPLTVIPPHMTTQKTWDLTRYYGANPEAFRILGKAFDYQMVYCERCGVNCFLVHKDELKNLGCNTTANDDVLPRLSYPAFASIASGDAYPGHKVDDALRKPVHLQNHMIQQLKNGNVNEVRVNDDDILKHSIAPIPEPSSILLRDVCSFRFYLSDAIIVRINKTPDVYNKCLSSSLSAEAAVLHMGEHDCMHLSQYMYNTAMDKLTTISSSSSSSSTSISRETVLKELSEVHAYIMQSYHAEPWNKHAIMVNRLLDLLDLHTTNTITNVYPSGLQPLPSPSSSITSTPLMKRNALVEVKLGTKDSPAIQRAVVGISFCNVGDRQRLRLCSSHGLPPATCELLQKEINNKRKEQILNGFSTQELVTISEMKCFQQTDLSSFAETEMQREGNPNPTQGNKGNEGGKSHCDEINSLETWFVVGSPTLLDYSTSVAATKEGKEVITSINNRITGVSLPSSSSASTIAMFQESVRVNDVMNNNFTLLLQDKMEDRSANSLSTEIFKLQQHHYSISSSIDQVVKRPSALILHEADLTVTASLWSQSLDGNIRIIFAISPPTLYTSCMTHRSTTTTSNSNSSSTSYALVLALNEWEFYTNAALSLIARSDLPYVVLVTKYKIQEDLDSLEQMARVFDVPLEVEEMKKRFVHQLNAHKESITITSSGDRSSSDSDVDDMGCKNMKTLFEVVEGMKDELIGRLERLNTCYTTIVEAAQERRTLPERC